jgi:septal ring-binding cell division protein DamX
MNNNATFNLNVTKQKFVFKLLIVVTLLILSLIVSSCSAQQPVPDGTITPTLSGEASLESNDTPTEPAGETIADDVSEVAGETTVDDVSEVVGETSAEDISEAVISRTPVPTPMPSYINRGITEFTQSRGIYYSRC